MLGTTPIFGMQTDIISPDEIRAFLGTNSSYYLQQFAKFTRTGVEKFVPTWNWSCFGFTFLWMLYRKMYLAALLTFVIFCVPGVNVILHIVAGVVGNYLYYRHAQEKLGEIRAIHSAERYLQLLPEAGGVHKWVIWWGIIVSVILTLLFILFFTTIIASMSKVSGIVI